MMLSADDAPALPLWINGHAYLTVVEHFFDITHPNTGETLRRTPLCGADSVAEAVNAASTALAGGGACSADQRREQLLATAVSLEGYAAHFAKLIGEETDKDTASAAAEVAAAIAVLRHSAESSVATGKPAIVGLLIDAASPLLASAALIGPAIASGVTLVAKPSPRAPSCALALAELLTRAGVSDGACNIVHGDDAVVEALAAHPDLALLGFAGDTTLAVKIAAIAERHGKRLFSAPVAQAADTWRQALASTLA